MDMVIPGWVGVVSVIGGRRWRYAISKYAGVGVL
jgi:hypothetical protein